MGARARTAAVPIALLLLAAVASWWVMRGDPRESDRTPTIETTRPGDDTEARRHVRTGDETTPAAETATAADADTPRARFGPYYVSPVRLRPGAVARLTGRVLDHEGRPVAGAGVSVWSTWLPSDALVTDPDAPRYVGRTGTDESGRFEIDVARGGPVEVRVSDVSGAVVWTDRLIDTHRPLDVVLPEPNNLRVAGRVVDEEGSPVEGVTVVLKPDRRFPPENSHDTWPTARSGEGGRWTVDATDSGRWIAFARKDGFAPAHAGVFVSGAGDDEPVEIVLHAGVTIHGLVVDDESERPVEGAHVEWGSPDARHSTVSARDGSFSLRVASRRVVERLEAFADGYVPRRTSVASEQVTPDDAPITLRMQRPGTIRMRCVDARGEGAPDVTATVTARSQGTYLIRAYVAHGDGTLVLDGLPPAPADISVVFHTGGIPVLERTFAAPATRQTLDAGDVVLPDAVEVRGTLLQADGSPAETGWVVAAPSRPDDPNLSALTAVASSWRGHFSMCDDAGRFSLPGLTQGTWDVFAWGEGLPPFLRRGVVIPAASTSMDLDLRMPPPLRLTLRVVTGDDAPVAGVGLVVWREHPLRYGQASSGETDAEGRAAFDGFAPDVPRVWVDVELPDGDRGAWVDPREGEAELRVPLLRERDDDERP